MPYVPKSDRIDLNQKIVYAGRGINNAGELNYLLTRIVDQYIYAQGKSYTSINEAIGALECAKLELYRRIAAPYEDTKIQQNGDVYTI